MEYECGHGIRVDRPCPDCSGYFTREKTPEQLKEMGEAYTQELIELNRTLINPVEE